MEGLELYKIPDDYDNIHQEYSENVTEKETQTTIAKSIEKLLNTFQTTQDLDLISQAYELFQALIDEDPIFFVSILSDESYLTLIQIIQECPNPNYITFAAHLISCITCNQDSDFSLLQNLNILQKSLDKIYQRTVLTATRYFLAIFLNFAGDDIQEYSSYARQIFLSNQEQLSQVLFSLPEFTIPEDIPACLKNISRILYNLLKNELNSQFCELIIQFIGKHIEQFMECISSQKWIFRTFQKAAEFKILKFDQFCSFNFPELIKNILENPESNPKLVYDSLLVVNLIYHMRNCFINFGDVPLICYIAKNNLNSPISDAAFWLLIELIISARNITEFPTNQIFSEESNQAFSQFFGEVIQENIFQSFNFNRKKTVINLILRFIEGCLRLFKINFITQNLIFPILFFIDETEDKETIHDFFLVLAKICDFQKDQEYNQELMNMFSDLINEISQPIFPFLSQFIDNDDFGDENLIIEANVLYPHFII